MPTSMDGAGAFGHFSETTTILHEPDCGSPRTPMHDRLRRPRRIQCHDPQFPCMPPGVTHVRN